MRRALVLVLVALAGCAQAVSFNECNTDADCVSANRMAAGQPLIYCTPDHACVDELPSSRLCPTTFGSTDPAALRMGALFRLPDQSAKQVDVIKDQERVQALELVVDNFNQHAATGAQSLQVVLCNSGGEGPNDATRAYQALVQQHHVSAIVGEPTSGGVHTVAPFLPTDNVLLVTPAATTADISTLAQNGLIFRTCPSDDLQAMTLANLVLKLGGTPTVDVIHADSTSGKLLDASFVGYLGPAHQPKFDYEYNADTSKPTDAIAATVIAHKPDVLIVLADSDIPPLLAAAAAAAPSGWPGATTEILLPLNGKTAQLIQDPVAEANVLAKVIGVEPADPMTPVSAAFLQNFNQYIKADATAPFNATFVPQTYDAAFLVAAALAAAPAGARGTDLAAFFDGSLKTTSGQPEQALFNDFLPLVDAMQKKKGVQFSGASGNIQFTSSGDIANPMFGIWKVDPVKAQMNQNPFSSYPLP